MPQRMRNDVANHSVRHMRRPYRHRGPRSRGRPPRCSTPQFVQPRSWNGQQWVTMQTCAIVPTLARPVLRYMAPGHHFSHPAQNTNGLRYFSEYGRFPIMHHPNSCNPCQSFRGPCGMTYVPRCHGRSPSGCTTSYDVDPSLPPVQCMYVSHPVHHGIGDVCHTCTSHGSSLPHSVGASGDGSSLRHSVGASGDGSHTGHPASDNTVSSTSDLLPSLNSDDGTTCTNINDTLANKIISVLDDSLIEEISKEYASIKENVPSESSVISADTIKMLTEATNVLNNNDEYASDFNVSSFSNKPCRSDEDRYSAGTRGVEKIEAQLSNGKILATLPVGDDFSDIYLLQKGDGLKMECLSLLCEDRRIRNCTLECKNGEWAMHLDIDDTIDKHGKTLERTLPQ